MAGFTEAPLIKVLAVPGVTLLIAFLGYFSQLLFNLSSLEPGPLSHDETVVFNVMLAILYVAYFRAVMTDPGNYAASFDSPGGPNGKGNGAGTGAGNTRGGGSGSSSGGVVIDLDESAGGRWCGKCSAPKPRRAHHCRHCERCVPKMDHHCPWTANCVSMTTFPHFLRFLLWANLSLWALGYLACGRLAALWRDRDLPSYLGPSLPALAGLAVVSLVGSVTALALFIMLVNTVKGWLFNQTMIEGWEMDRHEALLSRRHGRRGWWDDNDDDAAGKPLERVEFPYDVGLWENMCQAMGSRNPLWWLVPLAGNPRVGAGGKGPGWEWEENGFNREAGMWPPPDPEKARRAGRSWPASRRDFAAELRDVDAADGQNGGDAREAFRKRQEADQLRRRRTAARKLVAELEEEDDDDDYGSDDYDHDDIDDDDEGYKRRMPLPGPWVNSDGETLHDYGVDEDAEAEDGLELLPDGDNDNYDDDDVPLAELMRRRKARKA